MSDGHEEQPPVEPIQATVLPSLPEAEAAPPPVYPGMPMSYGGAAPPWSPVVPATAVRGPSYQFLGGNAILDRVNIVLAWVVVGAFALAAMTLILTPFVTSNELAVGLTVGIPFSGVLLLTAIFLIGISITILVRVYFAWRIGEETALELRAAGKRMDMPFVAAPLAIVFFFIPLLGLVWAVICLWMVTGSLNRCLAHKGIDFRVMNRNAVVATVPCLFLGVLGLLLFGFRWLDQVGTAMRLIAEKEGVRTVRRGATMADRFGLWYVFLAMLFAATLMAGVVMRIDFAFGELYADMIMFSTFLLGTALVVAALQLLGAAIGAINWRHIVLYPTAAVVVVATFVWVAMVGYGHLDGPETINMTIRWWPGAAFVGLLLWICAMARDKGSCPDQPCRSGTGLVAGGVGVMVCAVGLLGVPWLFQMTISPTMPFTALRYCETDEHLFGVGDGHRAVTFVEFDAESLAVARRTNDPVGYDVKTVVAEGCTPTVLGFEDWGSNPDRFVLRPFSSPPLCFDEYGVREEQSPDSWFGGRDRRVYQSQYGYGEGEIESSAITPDGAYGALMIEAGEVEIVDLSKGEVVKRITALNLGEGAIFGKIAKRPARSYGYSDDGEYATADVPADTADADWSDTPVDIEAQYDQTVLEEEIDLYQRFPMAFTSDGKYLLVATRNPVGLGEGAYRPSYVSSRERGLFEAYVRNEPRYAQISRDAPFVLQAIDWRTGKVTPICGIPNFNKMMIVPGSDEDVTKLKLLLASSDYDDEDSLALIDAESQATVWTRDLDLGYYRDDWDILAVSQDGKHYLYAQEGEEWDSPPVLQIRTIASDDLVHSLAIAADSDIPGAGAFSHGQPHVAVGFRGFVAVWDVKKGSLVKRSGRTRFEQMLAK